MFYAEKTSNALRFGDVIRGFLSTTPVITEPALKEPFKSYNIDVNVPIFSVVMDPCCQIGNKSVSLTPLIQIRISFFDNPYLAEDLTRVNRKMEPQQAVPPLAWEKLSQEEKQKRMKIGREYAFVGLFIYEKHDRLPKYTVQRKENKIETNYYMIDFRNIHKLCCDKINSPTDAPLETKILELSVKTRTELRDKISVYYATPPIEDKLAED